MKKEKKGFIIPNIFWFIGKCAKLIITKVMLKTVECPLRALCAPAPTPRGAKTPLCLTLTHILFYKTNENVDLALIKSNIHIKSCKIDFNLY